MQKTPVDINPFQLLDDKLSIHLDQSNTAAHSSLTGQSINGKMTDPFQIKTTGQGLTGLQKPSILRSSTFSSSRLALFHAQTDSMQQFI
jgi:hypothetical protein